MLVSENEFKINVKGENDFVKFQNVKKLELAKLTKQSLLNNILKRDKSPQNIGYSMQNSPRANQNSSMSTAFSNKNILRKSNVSPISASTTQHFETHNTPSRNINNNNASYGQLKQNKTVTFSDLIPALKKQEQNKPLSIQNIRIDTSNNRRTSPPATIQFAYLNSIKKLTHNPEKTSAVKTILIHKLKGENTEESIKALNEVNRKQSKNNMPNRKTSAMLSTGGFYQNGLSTSCLSGGISKAINSLSKKNTINIKNINLFKLNLDDLEDELRERLSDTEEIILPPDYPPVEISTVSEMSCNSSYYEGKIDEFSTSTRRKYFKETEIDEKIYLKSNISEQYCIPIPHVYFNIKKYEMKLAQNVNKKHKLNSFYKGLIEKYGRLLDDFNQFNSIELENIRFILEKDKERLINQTTSKVNYVKVELKHELECLKHFKTYISQHLGNVINSNKERTKNILKQILKQFYSKLIISHKRGNGEEDFLFIENILLKWNISKEEVYNNINNTGNIPLTTKIKEINEIFLNMEKEDFSVYSFNIPNAYIVPPNLKIVGEFPCNDGKVIKLYENFLLEIILRNRTKLRLFNNGFFVSYYINKDVRLSFKDGRMFTLYNTGVYNEIISEFIFPQKEKNFVLTNFFNQQIEKHLIDKGVTYIKYFDNNKGLLIQQDETEYLELRENGNVKKILKKKNSPPENIPN
jgi:hypothetical protein